MEGNTNNRWNDEIIAVVADEQGVEGDFFTKVLYNNVYQLVYIYNEQQVISIPLKSKIGKFHGILFTLRYIKQYDLHDLISCEVAYDTFATAMLIKSSQKLCYLRRSMHLSLSCCWMFPSCRGKNAIEITII